MRGNLPFIWLLLILLVGCAPASAEFPPAATLPTTATPEQQPADLIYLIDPADGRFLSHIFAVDAHQPRLAFTLQTRMTPEATLSHDGRFLYVADSYLSRVTRGEQHDVYSVYDAHSGRLLQADRPIPDRLLYKLVPVAGYPHFFLAADDSRLFVGRYGDSDIGRLRLSGLEPETGELLFTGPYPPCDQVIQAGADRWLCLNEADERAELVWVDPNRAESIETLFTFPDGRSEGLALSADDRFLFVLGGRRSAAETAVAVWRFDLQAESVWGDEGTLLLPEDRELFWQGLAPSPDGSRLYVALASRPCCGLTFEEIQVFDTITWERVGALLLPQPASHLAVSGNGQTLYAVSPDTQQLFYFEAHTLQERGVLEGLGERPFQLLVGPG